MNRVVRRLAAPWLGMAATLMVTSALFSSPPAHAAGSDRARPPRTVVAASFEADSVLYRIHPTSGRATEIGPAGIQLTDIAFRGKTLYGISFTALYTVDTTTGAASVVGSLGISDANALTMRPRGRTLLGADLSGQLFKVNRRTGATRIIGTFGHRLVSSGDLAFIGRHLYAAVNRRGKAATLLARVNVRTGKATVIGKTGFRKLYGLTSSKGHLYGGTVHGDLVSISTKTGKAHRLSRSGLAIGGLSS